MREPQDPPCDLAPEGMKGDRLLDTLGLFCPVPIVRTAEAIRRMAAGEVLEVLSDDRVILLDMPAWCRSTGHRFLGMRRDGPTLHLFLKKKDGGTP